MTFRNIATVALIVALLSMGVYWLVTRPTPEEKALKEFFREFRMGHYPEAQNLTSGDDFYEMAAATSVRDSNGTQYLIGDYFPPERSFVLQASIETYVKPHIAKWKYLSMDTQRIEDGGSVVHFRIELAIRDFTTSGGLLGTVHDGRVEGTAHMALENGHWVVERFDLNLFSDEGLVLADYLSRAG